MPAQRPSEALLRLARSFSKLNTSDPLTQCLAPRLCRKMATEAPLPTAILTESRTHDQPPAHSTPAPHFAAQSTPTAPKPTITAIPKSSEVLTTLYSWPAMEPLRFAHYHPQHLSLPLRRDILHRAVVYEADASRQGTASTKWRKDVRGSGRKILPQKGTGHARAGDKKSPIRRGGGVAFGPHPRDFSTRLQRKVYDLAWRTALSYRYRRGELIVVDEKIVLPRGKGGRFLANIFLGNQWGEGHGRSLLVTKNMRKRLFREMAEVGEHGVVKDIADVDVKDILETGRVIIEKEALNILLSRHGKGLGIRAAFGVAAKPGEGGSLEHSNQLKGDTGTAIEPEVGRAVGDATIGELSTSAV